MLSICPRIWTAFAGRPVAGWRRRGPRAPPGGRPHWPGRLGRRPLSGSSSAAGLHEQAPTAFAASGLALASSAAICASSSSGRRASCSRAASRRVRDGSSRTTVARWPSPQAPGRAPRTRGHLPVIVRRVERARRSLYSASAQRPRRSTRAATSSACASVPGRGPGPSGPAPCVRGSVSTAIARCLSRSRRGHSAHTRGQALRLGSRPTSCGRFIGFPFRYHFGSPAQSSTIQQSTHVNIPLLLK